MKPAVYIFDSYALICFFLGEPGADFVKGLLRKKDEVKQSRIKLSLVNWGEVYYSISRNKGKVFAQEVLTLIDQYPIELVGLDRDFVYQAAQIKASYAISYADSFTAALAMREGGTIVTGDPEFRKLGNQIPIHWLK